MIPSRALLAAARAALSAAAITVLTERARVTDATVMTPFVVLEAPDLTRGTERVQRRATASSGTLQTTTMGVSSEQTLWLQEKVETALLDAALPLPGYRCDPVTMLTARWLEPFTELPDRVLYQYATVWRVRTQDL